MKEKNDNNAGIMMFDLPGDSKPVASVNPEHDEKSLTGQNVAVKKDVSSEELAKMKQDPNAVRGVLKSRIDGILEKSSKIIANSHLVYGRNQRELGKLLKEARRTFKTNKEYMEWLRENFSQHLRTLEEAQQLAGLGKFGEDFEGIPKNSLLAFARIRHDDDVVEFMAQNPAPVVNPDEDLTPRKNYAHTVIIYKRFHDEGIILTPNTAEAIAITCNKPLEKNAVRKVAEQIHEQPTNEKKAEFIQKWLKDGCVIERDKTPKKSLSLGSIIVQLKDFSKNYDLNDAATLSAVNAEDVRNAYLAIWTLAQKIKINLSPPNQEGEQSKSADTDAPEQTNIVQLVQEKVVQAL